MGLSLKVLETIRDPRGHYRELLLTDGVMNQCRIHVGM